MIEGTIYWDTPKGYWEAFQEIYYPIKIECNEKDFREKLLLCLNNLHRYGDNWILRVEYNTDTSVRHSNKSDDIVRTTSNKEDVELQNKESVR